MHLFKLAHTYRELKKDARKQERNFFCFICLEFLKKKIQSHMEKFQLDNYNFKSSSEDETEKTNKTNFDKSTLKETH